MTEPILLDPAPAGGVVQQPNDFRRRGTDGPPVVPSATKTRQPKGNKPELVAKAQARGIDPTGMTVPQLKEALGPEPADEQYGRPSGFGDPLENSYSLRKYIERNLALGVHRLLDPNGAPEPDDHDALDRLVVDAQNAVDAMIWADRGTHVHQLVQWYEEERPWQELVPAGEALGIPAPLQAAIVAEWEAMKDAHGVVVHGCEMPVVNDELRIAGTSDLSVSFVNGVTVGDRMLLPYRRAIGDIKTGDPREKYAVQLAGYQGAVPFDLATETRQQWDEPHDDQVAFIFHMSMKDALAGQPPAWRIIPVDLEVGRDGARICCEARDWPTRPVFGEPLQASGATPSAPETAPVEPTVDDAPPSAPGAEHDTRRERLRERYRSLTDTQQRQFADMGIDPDDLDAIEVAIDQLDPFAWVAEPAPREPAPEPDPVPVLDEGDDIDDNERDILRAAWALLEPDQAAWVQRVVARTGNLSVQQRSSERRWFIGMALVKLAAAGWHDDELLAACLRSSNIDDLATADCGAAIVLNANVSRLVTDDLKFSVDSDGDMRLVAA